MVISLKLLRKILVNLLYLSNSILKILIKSIRIFLKSILGPKNLKL